MALICEDLTCEPSTRAVRDLYPSFVLTPLRAGPRSRHVGSPRVSRSCRKTMTASLRSAIPEHWRKLPEGVTGTRQKQLFSDWLRCQSKSFCPAFRIMLWCSLGQSPDLGYFKALVECEIVATSCFFNVTTLATTSSRDSAQRVPKACFSP